jgi:hypothetical protein
MGMGMIGKVVSGVIGAKLLHSAMDSKVNSNTQYIPARGETGIMDKASRFYRENPKLVHTIGSAVVAIALAKFAQRNRG